MFVVDAIVVMQERYKNLQNPNDKYIRDIIYETLIQFYSQNCFYHINVKQS
jgi:hypothetical protein